MRRIGVKVAILNHEHCDAGIFAKTGGNDGTCLSAADNHEVVTVEQIIGCNFRSSNDLVRVDWVSDD